MSAPYKAANIPTYEPLNQRGEYDKWMKMMKETEGDRAELGGQKMDTLKSLLDKIPGYSDMQTGMSNMLTQLMGGQLTDTHKQVLEQQAGDIRTRMTGNQGGGADLNMTLASFGKAGLQAQQSAMRMVPQFMTNLRTSFMGNIAQDPSVMGPSWGEWGGQAQADHRDVFDSRVAQANATYQADMLNTQFSIQRQAQADSQARMNAANVAAQDRADRLASMQMHNQVQMQNANNYSAGMARSQAASQQWRSGRRPVGTPDYLWS